jgi:hypothetical protein
MTDLLTRPLRSEADILDDLKWARERLHDSQEHTQIVRLEERRDALWKELASVREARALDQEPQT